MAYLTAFLLLTAFVATSHAQDAKDLACPNNIPLEPLCMFVTPLVFPPTVDGTTGEKIQMGAYRITQKLHRDLPPTPMYAFGLTEATAVFPGPTIEAQVNVETQVQWNNYMEDPAIMLAGDHVLLWDGVPMVTHLHGGGSESQYDGHPDAWYTSKGQTGAAYITNSYVYHNDQQAASLWYHDHTIGVSRLMVYAGLAGLYIIRDPLGVEKDLQLPTGNYDLPLTFMDKVFWENGTLKMGTMYDTDPIFYADTYLVNGVIWPYFNVEPRMYRFRLNCASNTLWFSFFFHVAEAPFAPVTFKVITSDQGYLNTPITRSNLTMWPGERYDIVIDFSQFAPGSQILITNTSTPPHLAGPNEKDTKHVMKFLINQPLSNVLDPIMPLSLNNIGVADVSKAVAVPRLVTLTQHLEGEDPHIVTVTLVNDLRWESPVDILPVEGTYELWDLVNLSPDPHPVHIHLVAHRIIHRQNFDLVKFEAGLCQVADGSCLYGETFAPREEEMGWKDTTNAYNNQVTRILLHWAPFDGKNGDNFKFDVSAGPGYAVHCHILNHEDNQMMRPFGMLRANSTLIVPAVSGFNAELKSETRRKASKQSLRASMVKMDSAM